jgi:hypothetical protein
MEIFQLQAANMNSDSESGADTKPLLAVNINIPSYSSSEASSNPAVYIEPEKEAAAKRRFDKYFVPVSLIFIILASLDRNNVSELFAP